MVNPWLILNIQNHCLSSWSLAVCQGNIEQILMSGILQLCIMRFWIKWNSLCKKLYLSQLVVMKYNYEQLVLDIRVHIHCWKLKRVPIFFNLERVVNGNTSNFQTPWFNHLLQLVHSMCLFKLNLLKRGYTFIFEYVVVV